jgi:ABC-type transporter Mla MlaB component
MEIVMAYQIHDSALTLSGQWNLSGLVHQIESLTKLIQTESGLINPFRIDCSKINSVDMSGLQLLYVWLQCVTLRGAKPELINLPEDMHQNIKQLGLARCFSDFIRD